ncbi:MAG: cytoskeleton protein RodZ [Flavobacteriales bacterium]
MSNYKAEESITEGDLIEVTTTESVQADFPASELTESEVSDAEESSDIEVLDVGRVLKARREELKFSLADVEEKTRISIENLKGLEANEFSALGEEVYAYGYLCKVAKVLSLDSDPLLRQYKHECGIGGAANEALGLNVNEAGSGEKKAIKFSLVIGVFLLVVVVYFTLTGGKKAGLNEPSPVNVRVVPNATEALNARDVPNISDTLNTRESQQGVEAGELNSVIGLGVSTKVTALEDTDTQHEVVDSGIITIGNLTEPAPIVGVSSSLVQNSNDSLVQIESKLEIFFSEECWVQIKDKNSQVLFADMQNNGDNLQLFGLAPFDVMFGNARAVTLSIDDKPIVMTIPSSRNTLRITVQAP